MAEVRIDAKALWECMKGAPETVVEVDRATRAIYEAANSMGSSFRTGLYHRDHKSPAVGHTPPVYMGNVEMHHGTPVGIVGTLNYSSRCDNARNNTLIKSIG